MSVSSVVRARVFSGVQPTGQLTLGNYLGAIQEFVSLQEDYDAFYCVVDMHALSVFQNPEILRKNRYAVAAMYLASGIRPDKATVFIQSDVSAHSELFWVLSCVARIGWLSRMTQFKDKAGKNREQASAALYSYPILMASDILLYSPKYVPVGEDQKQHLELTRDIVQKFHQDYDCEIFSDIQPLVSKKAPRVMSLRDGSKKMSKSDASDFSRINLLDTPEVIRAKLMKARTDAEPFPTWDSLDDAGAGVSKLSENRPEVANLLRIYQACSNKSYQEILRVYQDQGFALFKKDLAEVIINLLTPIQSEYSRLVQDQTYLNQVLLQGAEQAYSVAQSKLQEVYTIIGLR